MSFNLNSKEFSTGSTIFNGGVAGLVTNNDISVEKKKTTDPDNAPDYKLVVTDEAGKTVNQGFYYYNPNDSFTKEENERKEKMQVGRVLHIAHAVVGKDYEFPEVSTSKEAFDTLFKIIRDNCAGKKFNVYVTYGSKQYPSTFLGLRYFNFIEPTNGDVSTLKPANADQMERIMPDSQDTSSTEEGSDDEEWA